ncbi:MAG: radical SAM protein [Desulfovibrionales bacterium]|nr:radical SAM protein [Desulfovibrionales bacterium]
MLPTEKCNFRCLYCYESHEGEVMGKEVERALTALLSRQILLRKKILINWFGGEPLLRKGLIRRVSESVVEQVRNTPDVTYTGCMTTNGYLLDEQTFLELLALGINDFQITLDGPAPLHDTMRPLANGGKTFATIWKNLCFAKSCSEDFSVLIRVHYTPETIGQIYAFQKELVRTFGGDERFSFFFRPVSRLGGENDACITSFSSAQRQEITEILSARSGTQCCPIPEEYICYAALPNSFGIRPNGELIKCTVALDDPRNHVGWLTSRGELDIDAQKMQPWISGLLNGDGKACRCPLQDINASKNVL